MKYLLSLDGGGALGCGSALFLATLESEADIAEDAIAGTSVGGILALLRASGMRWADIRAMFDADVGKIFHSVPWWWHYDPTRPKWQNDGLETMIRDALGTKRMSDASIPIYVPASDYQTGIVHYFTHHDSDLMADVALRTTAAPTYFAPRDSRWADGGIIANNPSSDALDALHADEGWAFDGSRCLSLASGGTWWDAILVGGRMAEIQWASPVIKFAMQATLIEAARRTTQALGSLNHLRIEPGETKYAEMDDLSILPAWRDLWQAAYAKHGDAAKLFLAGA